MADGRFDPPAPGERPSAVVPGLADVVARLRRAMRRAARAAQPDQTLSVAQFELLQAVAEHPEPRAGRIATALRLSPNSVTTLANSLAERGLMTRSQSERDRRVVYLRLTEAGERALDGWQTVNARILAEALGALEGGDRAAVETALPALAALIDQLNLIGPKPDGRSPQGAPGTGRRASPGPAGTAS